MRESAQSCFIHRYVLYWISSVPERIEGTEVSKMCFGVVGMRVKCFGVEGMAREWGVLGVPPI